MIDTLLDFTRARFMGRVPVSRVPTDLGEVSRGAIEEIRVAWPDYAIDLEVARRRARRLGSGADVADDLQPGHQRDLLRRERVRRARVHRRRRARRRPEGAQRRPRDRADDIPALFEPFRRGAHEDRSPRGLGLGLYIVKQIVQAHDGSIGVESTDAAGTTFTLHLPRGAGAAGAPAPA